MIGSLEAGPDLMASLILRPFPSLATGYYPRGYSTPEEARMEGGPLDRLGRPLHTIEEFLAGNAPYASAALDSDALPYGTIFFCPEIGKRYSVSFDGIVFRAVDTGSAFKNMGLSRVDFCVAGKQASLHRIGNMRGVILYILCLKSEGQALGELDRILEG